MNSIAAIRNNTPSFEEAIASFSNRYTMEHVPFWARTKTISGDYYAPQYKTDKEWYENTTFTARGKYCNSSNQSFPLGQFLTAPYNPNSRFIK